MKTLLISLLLLVAGCQTASLHPQVIKARESEAKVKLGCWTRYQQSYHFDNNKFNDQFSLNDSEKYYYCFENTTYYNFEVRDASPKGVVMTADPKKKYKQISGFIGFAAYINGQYSNQVCRLEQPLDSYDNIYKLELEDCE